MKVAIIGYGFVGKATEYLLQRGDSEIFIHDPLLGYSIELDDPVWDEIEFAFVCVPTPTNPETGALDASVAVQEALILPNTCVPVIRSTLGPDHVYRFPERTIFMPEFLRESSWKSDVDDPALPLIFGASAPAVAPWLPIPEGAANCRIVNLMNALHTGKRILFVDSELACMYKVARNTALAMTVAVANQLSEACEVTGVNYSDLSEMLTDDPVLANSHWDVPGPDGKSGFGGKCLPKDLSHAATLSHTYGMFPTSYDTSYDINDNNLFATALYINDNQWRT